MNRIERAALTIRAVNSAALAASAGAAEAMPKNEDDLELLEDLRVQSEYEKIIPLRDSVRDLIKSYASTLKTFVYPGDSLEDVMRIAYQDLCPTGYRVASYTVTSSNPAHENSSGRSWYLPGC